MRDRHLRTSFEDRGLATELEGVELADNYGIIITCGLGSRPKTAQLEHAALSSSLLPLIPVLRAHKLERSRALNLGELFRREM